ncbi:MAG: phage tail tape measure protein [Anaerovoracaceae bacterium]
MSLEKVFKLSLLVSMVDKLSGPTAKIGNEIEKTTDKFENFNSKISSLKSKGLEMVTVGTGVSTAMVSLSKSTFETSNALGELSSVGVENLYAVEKAATDFSNTWAGTNKSDFISAAYDIKSGISSLTDEGVAGYTELAGITAKATKATIGEMTDLFATGYGIYKDYYSDLTDMEFGQIFGAGIAKSVQAFKTNGSKMAQSIQTLGAAATSAQVPLEEQLAVLGMLQATMSGSEAGTKYKAFLKSAAKAGDSLGLSFLDANNQLLGMPEILEILRDEFGETLDAAEKMKLQSAFGTEEAVALIELLYSKTGDLQGNIESLYNSMGQGTSAIENMANKINSTDPSKYEIMNQKIQNMKESLGSLLLPVVMDIVEGSSKLVSKITEFAEKHPKLTGYILRVVLLFGVLTAAVGTVMVAFGLSGMVILNLSMNLSAFIGFGKKAIPIVIKFATTLKSFVFVVFNLARSALPGLISSVWSFTAALLANPVTWVVVGIVALIVAIVLLWKNWDKVTAFLKSTWQSFCNSLNTGIGFIKNGFASIVSFITGKMEWFRESGKKIITTLTSGMLSVASVPVKAIKSIFTKVRQYLPFSDAKEGPLSQLTLSGSKVITTMVSGMQQVEKLPAEETKKAFSKVPAAREKSIKKISLSEKKVSETTTSKTDAAGKKTIIQKLVMNVKLDDIEDIKKLKKLLEEIEDAVNSSDDDSDIDVDIITA